MATKRSAGGLVKRLLYGASAVVTMLMPGCGGKDPVDPGNDKPSIVLSAQLKEGTTDIGYNLSGKNWSSATLTASRNGVGVPSMTKTVGLGSGTYSDLEKGAYTFKATSGSESSSPVNATVINYNPDADFSSLPMTVSSNSELVWNLENIVKNSDKNKEDRPVPIQSVKSLDSNLSTSVEGYQARISSSSNASGESGVEVKYGTSEGGITTDTLKIGIEAPLTRTYSGQVQDNWTNSGVPAKMNFYVNSISQANFIGGPIQTDANGNWKVEVDANVQGPLLTEVVQAGETEKDFVRVIEMPGTSASGIIIRPERLRYTPDSYVDDFNHETHKVDKNTFRAYMEETNPNFITFKPKGIIIAKYDAIGKGTIPDSTVASWTSALGNPSGGKCDLTEYTNPLSIIVDDGTLSETDRHYVKNSDGDLEPEQGWGVIHRDTINASSSTKWYINNHDSKNLKSLRVRMKELRRDGILHEFYGHGALITGLGHSTSIKYPLTIMTTGGGGSNPDAYLGLADCDAIVIAQEETYTSGGTGIFQNPYDEILKINFNRYSTTSPKVKKIN